MESAYQHIIKLIVDRKFLLVVALVIAMQVFSQNDNPQWILDSLIHDMERIGDYKVDLSIEVDVEFINIPQKTAVMFYKHPDKVKFKSDDFLLIPKQGMKFSVRELLDKKYTAFFVEDDYINKREHYVIKVVPLSKGSEIILSTLYVEKEELRITRMENNTKNRGSYVVDFEYIPGDLPLSSRIVIMFEIEHVAIPGKLMGKMLEIDMEKFSQEKVQEGRVFLEFSNYEINNNYPDEFFQDEPK